MNFKFALVSMENNKPFKGFFHKDIGLCYKGRWQEYRLVGKDIIIENYRR